MNISLNRQKEAIDRIILYKHWLCHFEEMDDIFKRQVFEDIYNDLIKEGLEVEPLFEVMEQTLSPEDVQYMRSMLKHKSI